MNIGTDTAVVTNTEASKDFTAKYVDRRLLEGSAALMTGGLLIWLAGAAVGLVSLAKGCSRYLAAREEPPRVTARRRWGQSKSAMGAALEAWQDYGETPRPPAAKRLT